MNHVAPDTGTPALYLLGGIDLRGIPRGVADSLLAQTKVVALLAYLSLSPRDAFQRRDRIAGLLWPELDQSHARTALRKAIHLVRSALGDEAIAGRGDEDLALNHEALWSDTTEFQTAVEQNRLGQAVELYRDDLMPGFYLTGCHDFELWLEQRRASLLEKAVAASWALAQHLEATHVLTKATEMARHSARLARSNERAFRRALVMLERLGDRAGALNLYEQFAAALRKELETEPSAETRQLVEAIRAGRPLA